MTRPLGRGDPGLAAVEATAVLLVLLLTITATFGRCWGALALRARLDEAARAAARTYVEAEPAGAEARAREAAVAVLRAHGALPRGLAISHDDGPYRRCRAVTFRVRADAALWPVGPRHLGTVSVVAQHREVIDPYATRRGLGGVARCDA